MADTRTVGQMSASVRLRGDYEDDSGGYGDSYISDAVLIDFIDSAWKEAYDIMVTSDPDRYLSEHSFTTSADTAKYSLPSDLYKLRAVDMCTSSGTDDWYKVHRYEMGERDAWQDTSAGTPSLTPYVYKLDGSYIRLQPTPSGAKSVRLTYIPTAARLTSSLQSVDSINGHDELAILLALRRCKVRAAESTAEVDAEIARQTARVERMAADRDAGSPRRLIDPRTSHSGRRRRRW